MRISDWSSDLCSSDLDERLLVSPFVVNSEEYNENQDVAPLQSALQHLVTNVSFDALGSKRVVEASQNVMDAAVHERLVNQQAALHKITANDIPKPTQLKDAGHRKRVVCDKSVTECVGLGGSRIIKK